MKPKNPYRLPSSRPLRVYAFEPTIGRKLNNYLSIPVPYEGLTPGPVGKKLAVIDYDANNEFFYEAVDLRRCRHRPVQYLNNILEQDHRAIKRRVNAKQGFREFQAARRTIQGYEAINMIRKGQVRWVSGTDVRRQIQLINKLFELPA
jgi:DDE domain